MAQTFIPFGKLSTGGGTVGTIGLDICEGRLTLTSGVPVTTSDVTGAGTIYFTPYKGNRVALYDGTAWAIYTFSELSTTTPAGAGPVINDLFVYATGTAVALTKSANWTNTTTRADSLDTLNGIIVNGSDNTLRYLGTAAGTPSGCQDSVTQRYLWNYYNRIPRTLVTAISVTGTWTYNTNSWRMVNGSSLNRFEFVVGYQEDDIDFEAIGAGSNNSANTFAIGIGLDATDSNSAQFNLGGGSSAIIPLHACYSSSLTIGYHFVQMIEWGASVGTTTFYGIVETI